MPFDLLRSETVYTGRVFALRRDEVSVPEGKTTWLDIVAHPGATTMIPIDAEGRIWFVRQYRHAAGRLLLELPAGTLNPGESHDVCAAREIREEIGMGAGSLRHIGGFFLAPGYSTEYLHIYLATDLFPDPGQRDEDEFIDIVRLSIADAYALASTGQIHDGKTLAALLLAMPMLRK
jgi:ADP-ribose pyrophosphatase